MKKEDYTDFEYDQFIVKFMNSIEDIKLDFSYLSPKNKNRFNKDVKKLISVNFPEILQFLLSEK